MKKIFEQRFALLLAALLLDLLASPFVEGSKLGKLSFNVFSTVVLFSALYSISENKRGLGLGLILWVLAISGVWLGYFAPDASILATAPTLMTFFLIYTVYLILMHILRSDEVTSESIFASLCAYLLIGMIWSMFYFGLESIRPGSYQGLGTAADYAEGLGSSCLYYSYVTLTTLGYGDVTPVTAPARSLALVEAIIGQFFLAVLVARLVGQYIARSMKD